MKISLFRKSRPDDEERTIEHLPGDMRVFLAGNPNVGKSTVFNALTGLHRHTGNWSGKTVSAAEGLCVHGGRRMILTDLPGTYSLDALSPEETAARDCICYGKPDAVIVVCDASRIESNLVLVLRILEITPHVLMCVNLTDEAERKHIRTDTARLEELLGIPVCPTSARSGKGLADMLGRLEEAARNERTACPIDYPADIIAAADRIAEQTEPFTRGIIDSRFAALRILEDEEGFRRSFSEHTGRELPDIDMPCRGCGKCSAADITAAAAVRRSAEIAALCVDDTSADFTRDRKADRILTHPLSGLLIMAAVLLTVFLLTAEAMDRPSQLLMELLTAPEEPVRDLLVSAGLPVSAVSLFIDGIWHVMSWVISVMLPPAAIFFPIFTLLEDSGILPRFAFVLDRCFRASGGCGKQALTMAMGLGCTAAGVTGCRIIDSPRERLTAIITNSFTPCNGKLPTVIAMISIFLAGADRPLLSAAAMSGVMVMSFLMTLAASRLLSATVLKGEPSSFVLELPSYRRPQFAAVLVHSFRERTLPVLARAAVSSVPAGIMIWLCANVTAGDSTLLEVLSQAAEPVGRAAGLDGKIIMAFLLGFPANETVLPILLMAYAASSGMTGYEDFSALGAILRDNGWTGTTAVCMTIMMICHFPCATSCLTIKRETGSLKYTLISMLLPAAAGMMLCMAVNLIAR